MLPISVSSQNPYFIMSSVYFSTVRRSKSPLSVHSTATCRPSSSRANLWAVISFSTASALGSERSFSQAPSSHAARIATCLRPDGSPRFCGKFEGSSVGGWLSVFRVCFIPSRG